MQDHCFDALLDDRKVLKSQRHDLAQALEDIAVANAEQNPDLAHFCRQAITKADA